MQAYTVYESPTPAADRVDRAEALVFVKDGFSWAAFLFAPIWMLMHRLWWVLLGYAGAVAGLQLIGWALGQQNVWATLAALGFNLILGFEASSLRRWTLERGGWTMVGAATGATYAAAERTFFDNWLPAQPMIAPAPVQHPQRRAPLGSLSQLFGARS
jgi:hypothetical protein